MKKEMLHSLQVRMDQFLADCDESYPDHELVHEKLADQMATAAAVVYDACQDAQRFLKRETVTSKL